MFDFVQYFAGGARAEAEIAKYLKDIMSIVKLGYSFANASYRTKVDQYIMRNTDQGTTLSLHTVYANMYNMAVLTRYTIRTLSVYMG